MDNREFVIKQDELHRAYFAKLSALAEAHQASLEPQFRQAMEQVLAEASAKIQSVATQTEALQDHVVDRAQKTLETIEEQTKDLAESCKNVLRTAQESSLLLSTTECRVAEKMSQLVSATDIQTQQMIKLVEDSTATAMGILKNREDEAETRILELRQQVSNAGYNAAQTLIREVNAWGVLVRWVTAPIFVAAMLATIVGATWFGRENGKQMGYDEARLIARDQVKADLAVNAFVLRPIYDSETGAVTALKGETLTKPIVIVDGHPRWMNHDAQGWFYGNVRLIESWHIAEVWDRKDKTLATISSVPVE